jgi:hypothetical protein
MKTIALVIGNDKYFKGFELNNAVNDAKAIADVFERLGYDVILRMDISESEIVDLLRDFRTRLAEYEASIFYFAGHGFQVGGENYLASVTCQIPPMDKYSCRNTCIHLSEIMEILKENVEKVNIVVIDACRGNFERGQASSFYPVQAPKGTLIAFSTSPNEGASDHGRNGHSVYTSALLEYLGREYLTVEELFKKVRRTVYAHTGGSQTTWEHTSLIGDFYFNSGQMIHSLTLPYDEKVIKDVRYEDSGDKADRIIFGLRSHKWDEQNEAMDVFNDINARSLNKNKKFLIGRNIMQACCGNSFGACNFLERLEEKLIPFQEAGENHLLNGILFEIYFNSMGEFRGKRIKHKKFDVIMSLRRKPIFAKSFEFIGTALLPYEKDLYFIPLYKDKVIDVDISATRNRKGEVGSINYESLINLVAVNGDDIKDQIIPFYTYRSDELQFVSDLAVCLSAPKELIHLNSNIELSAIVIEGGEPLF